MANGASKFPAHPFIIIVTQGQVGKQQGYKDRHAGLRVVLRPMMITSGNKCMAVNKMIKNVYPWGYLVT